MDLLIKVAGQPDQLVLVRYGAGHDHDARAFAYLQVYGMALGMEPHRDYRQVPAATVRDQTSVADVLECDFRTTEE